MKITHITPGLLPIPPNGWGAVEKIIWEVHNNLLSLGHESSIKYLDDLDGSEDVVHIHVANLANLAHKRGIQYYFTFHDHHAYLYGKDSQLYVENLEAIKNAKKAFVPAKYLIDYFEGIPEYVSHGVNVERFKPNKSGEVRLLCVANNGFAYNQSEDRKGFGLAIEAAKRLNLPITIAGPSNNRSYFEKYPPSYSKLRILYDLEEDALEQLYREHSIFLHPSIIEAGHPNLTLLEAIASGLPVVGTYESNSNLNGMIQVSRDVQSLIDGINKLLDSKTYRTYSLLARKEAESRSWTNITQQLVEKYNVTGTMKEVLIDAYEHTSILRRESQPNKPKLNINFIQGAYCEITGGPDIEYEVKFIDKKTGVVEHQGKVGKNCWIKANKAYYVDWLITVSDGKDTYRYEQFLENQRVYVALDSKALGDTLAWIPYVEEFRKEHKCKIICSTFHNNLFQKEYPEIEFVEPEVVVHNLYAMYVVGWFYTSEGSVDLYKNPNDFKLHPLQKTCSDILGLKYRELVPKITKKPNVKQLNRISIAIHGTAQAKYWNNPEGWTELVRYFSELGYEVIIVSKEETGYMGNYHPPGVQSLTVNSLESVIEVLQSSKLFVGISSGLSWLSWAVGTTTCIISGFTDPFVEGTTNVLRVKAPNGVCSGCNTKYRLDAGDWNWCPVHKGTEKQFECSKAITARDVIEVIAPFL